MFKKHKWLIILWSLAILTIAGFGWYQWAAHKDTSTVTPQTTTVSKKTLTQIVSAAGKVSAANQTAITTQATGRISRVYHKVGDAVKKGDALFEIEPDLVTTQNEENAWAAYLTAKTAVDKAVADSYTLAAN